MRITLTLDDDVAARLQASRVKAVAPWASSSMSPCEGASPTPRAPKPAAVFRVEALRLGAPLPGRDYDRIGALLDDIEGPEHR